MSQENIEIFQECREAFGRGDVDPFLRLVDEDVVWIPARSVVEGRLPRHEGLRELFADNEQSFELFEPDVREVRDLGNRPLVFGVMRLRGRGSSLETDIPVAGVVTFESGKIVRWEDFRERHLALEAVGLSE